MLFRSLEANPGERFPMFRFMVGVALADRQVDRPEVELLFEVGEGVFGFQRKEIAQVLAEALQKTFVPRLTLAAASAPEAGSDRSA